MVRHSDKTKELMIVLQVSPIGLSESQLTSFKEQVKKLFIDSLVVDADGSFAKVCASSQGPDNSSTTRDIKDSDNMDGIEVSTNDSNPATTVNESSSQRLHLTSLQLMYYSGFSNAPLPETSSCEVLYGQDHIHDIVCGLKFRLSVFSFFQVNSLGAEVIYNKVAQWIGLPNSSQENSSRSTSMSSLSSSNISSNSASSQPVLLDVCCGTGTIGLTLARHVKETIGLELVADAIKDAKVNAKLNGITNAKFICGKAETTIRSVFQYLSNPSQYPLAESVAETENSSSIAESIDADSSSSSSSGNTVPTQSNTYSRVHDSAVVAVVDPPRSGLHADVIRAIRTSKIKRLVYVSCNPNTLSENLIKLCGASSSRYKGAPFKAIKAVPVDMFAHTPHCEMIMLLER
jgi:tRNA (uracil-5-)-methyltransferase